VTAERHVRSDVGDNVSPTSRLQGADPVVVNGRPGLQLDNPLPLTSRVRPGAVRGGRAGAPAVPLGYSCHL